MSSSSGLIPKKVREKCWVSRDAYWDCVAELIKESNSRDEKEFKRLCAEERKTYEADCPKTWISLFDQKKDFELFKSKKFEESLKKGIDSPK